MSFILALEPLVSTVVQLLAESVRRGVLEGRGRLAYLVRILPLLNRESRDLWRKEPDAQLLLTFCDYAFGTGHRARYLDGVLPDAANDPHTWSEQVVALPSRVLDIGGIHKSRTLCIKGPTNTEDVSDSNEKIFMQSILNMHHTFKQHGSYARHFGECQRVGCVRPGLLTPPEPEMGGEEPSASEYWKCCRDGRSPPPASSLPSDMCFCCHGCYKATNAEFKKLVKFDIATPASQQGRDGATTPSRLYQAAVQRNQSIARRIRSQPQVETKHYPSTMANREHMIREQTIMLSVDLGILYAASIVYELPSRLRPKRPLPNNDDWRNRANCYLGAICRVRQLYMMYGRGILARGETELWLRRLRDCALDIF